MTARLGAMGLALGLHLMPGVSKFTVDAGYTVCGLRLKTSIFRMLVLTMVCMRFYATRFKIKGITSKFGVNLVWVVRGVGRRQVPGWPAVRLDAAVGPPRC